jgi:hypothetical protein
VQQARAELVADLRRADALLRETRKNLAVAVRASGTSLTGVFGVGPARRFRVVQADTGGLSRLTASSSSFTATVGPSVRMVPATAVARARVSGVRAVLSAKRTGSSPNS